jgi:predicted GIY-YIG superfamily endonuclease
VFREVCQDRSQAAKRECAIKKMTRHEKLHLINSSAFAETIAGLG